MKTLPKLSIISMLACGLYAVPALAVDDTVGQGEATTSNTTTGGGEREMAPINEGAREINEGQNPNLNPAVDPKDIDRHDMNDANEGYDGMMLTILLVLGAGLTWMVMVANRRRIPVDSQFKP